MKIEAYSAINNYHGYTDTSIGDSFWFECDNYFLCICFQPIKKWKLRFFLFYLRNNWLSFGTGHAVWGKLK